MKRLVFAALVAVFAFPANASMFPQQWTVPCSDDVNEIHRYLEEQYGETLSMGTQAENGSFEMYNNPTTGTWTIIFVYPDGKACAPLSGTEAWVKDPGI